MECPVPIVITYTNADLVKSIMQLRHTLDLCNIDKAAIREWGKVLE